MPSPLCSVSDVIQRFCSSTKRLAARESSTVARLNGFFVTMAAMLRTDKSTSGIATSPLVAGAQHGDYDDYDDDDDMRETTNLEPWFVSMSHSTEDCTKQPVQCTADFRLGTRPLQHHFIELGIGWIRIDKLGTDSRHVTVNLEPTGVRSTAHPSQHCTKIPLHKKSTTLGNWFELTTEMLPPQMGETVSLQCCSPLRARSTQYTTSCTHYALQTSA